MSKSTGYRFIQTMIEIGFLDRDSTTGHIKIGLRFIQLGHLAQTEFSLVRVARPIMRNVADETHETVLLPFYRNERAFCAEKIESLQAVKLSFDLGASLPLHAGASSLVLLAQLNDEEISQLIAKKGLIRFTKHTIVDIKELKKRVNKIREQGYVITYEEHDLGGWAVSSPIRGLPNGTIAGLTVSGPMQRLTPTRQNKYVTLVCGAAKKISDLLS